jgi:hypothetical protein
MNPKMIMFIFLIISFIILLMITLQPLNNCSYYYAYKTNNNYISCNLFSYLNQTIVDGQLMIQRHNIGFSDGILEFNDNNYIDAIILGNYYFIMLTRICVVASYLVHVLLIYLLHFNIYPNIMTIINLTIMLFTTLSFNNITLNSISNYSWFYMIMITYQLHITLDSKGNNEQSYQPLS